MASNKKIRGITIELSADASGVLDAVKNINSKISTTAKQLRDVDKLLKLDPSNMDLLKQKTQYLQEQIGNAKEKLDALKQAQKDMDANGISKNSEQYQALQREIIATEQQLSQLKDTTGSGSAALAQISTVTGEVGDKMENAGKKLSVLSAGIVALGVASVNAFKEFDAGADIVIQKTGATGDAAEDLQKSYKTVSQNIVGDWEDIGSAIGEVNTRFGLTGQELEDLSTSFLKFADINGMDVNNAIVGIDEALKTFNVDQSEANNVMGLLSKTAQDTGISMDEMLGLLQSSGPALKEMGLDIGSAVTLMGNFEAAGIDSSDMLGKLQKAAAYYNSEGLSMEEGLTDLIARLQDSDTAADATAEAYEIFGKRGGLAFVTAAQEGKLSISDLETALSDYGTVVSDTYEQTLDGTDKMALAWQNIQVALADLGKSVGNVLAPIMDKVTEIIQNIVEWFDGLDEGTQNTIVTIGLVVAAIGPLLLVGGKLVKGVSKVTDVLSKIGGASWGPIGIVITAVVTLTTAAVALLDSWKNAYLDSSPFREALDELKQKNDDLATSIDNTKSTYENTIATKEAEAAAADALAGKLDLLVDSYDGSIEKQNEIKLIVDELNKLVPDLGLAWDDTTESLNMNTAEIYNQINAMQAQAKVQALTSMYTDSLKEQYQAQKNLNEANETFRGVLERSGLTASEFGEMITKIATNNWTLGDSINFLAQHGINSQGVIEELTEAYSAQNAAVRNLETVNEDLKFAEDELSVAITAAAEATNASTRNIEDRFSQMEVSISESMDSAIKIAQNAGIRIPQTLVDGLKNGQISEQNAIDRMNSLVQFNTAVKTANVDGIRVSQSFIDAWLSGEYDLQTANSYYNSFVEFSQALENAQTQGQEITPAFVNELLDAYGLAKVTTAAQEIGEAAVPKVPEDKVEQAARDTNQALANEMEASSDVAEAAAEDVAEDVADEFSDMPEKVGSYGTSAGEKLDTGFGSNSGSISRTIDDIWNLYYNTLGNLLPGKMWEWGYNAGGSYERGFNQISISGILDSIYQSVSYSSTSLGYAAYNAGSATGSGYYNGLYAWYPYIIDLAQSIANNVYNTIRNSLQIHSPSKVMERIGEYTGEGFALGLQNSAGGIYEEMNAIAENLTGSTAGINALNANVRSLNMATMQSQQNQAEFSGIMSLLSQYLPYLAEKQDIVLDDGTLAGHMAPAMNNALELLNIRTQRG